FLTSYLGIYHTYLHLLLLQHTSASNTHAFALAQQSKARALLDLLSSGKVQLSKSLTVEERQKEQQLRSKADFLNVQMVKEGVQNEVGARQRFAALQEQLKQAESELQTYTDTLYAHHPNLAHKRAAHTCTLAEVGTFLPTDTALLEYVVLK